MIRSKTRRSIGLLVWILVANGGSAAIFAGVTEPTVSAADVGGGPVLVSVSVGGTVLGVLVYMYLSHRNWLRTAERIGLSPGENRLLPFGNPPLEGTKAGRPVRIRRISRKVNAGGESGSSRKTFTVVETDLRRPADRGVLVGRVPPGSGDSGEFEFGSMSIRGDTVGDRFVTTTNDEAVANATLSEDIRKALLVVDDVDKLLVGDASSVVMDAAETTGDSFLGGLMESAMDVTFEGNAGTVTHEIDGTVFDAEELERQLRAVVMTAESFEAAMADAEAETTTA